MEQAEAIIQAVGLPFDLTDNEIPEPIAVEFGARAPTAALAKALNDSAFALRTAERRQSMPSKVEVAGAAERISALCSDLIAEIHGSGSSALDGLGAGGLYAFAARENDSGAEAVERSVAEVRKLKSWADQLADFKRRQSIGHGPKKGRTKDEAWHALIERLSGVYYFHWRERPGLSTDPYTQEPGGPYYRFVRAVVEFLLPQERTDHAVASAIRRHRWPQGSEISFD